MARTKKNPQSVYILTEAHGVDDGDSTTHMYMEIDEAGVKQLLKYQKAFEPASKAGAWSIEFPLPFHYVPLSLDDETRFLAEDADFNANSYFCSYLPAPIPDDVLTSDEYEPKFQLQGGDLWLYQSWSVYSMYVKDNYKHTSGGIESAAISIKEVSDTIEAKKTDVYKVKAGTRVAVHVNSSSLTTPFNRTVFRLDTDPDGYLSNSVVVDVQSNKENEYKGRIVLLEATETMAKTSHPRRVWKLVEEETNE